MRNIILHIPPQRKNLWINRIESKHLFNFGSWEIIKKIQAKTLELYFSLFYLPFLYFTLQIFKEIIIPLQ